MISTSKNWWFGDFQKLWWWWFTYFLVIRICLNLEQKGLKIVILVLKILGDLIVFFLVIGDLRIHLVMVILAIFGWWFEPFFVGDLVIEGGSTPPLLSCLSKRVGILTKIHKYLSRKSFQKVMNGLFNGKLIYGISVWGSVWNLPGVLDIERRHSPALSKDDHNKLQILQNKVFRLATGLSIT